MCLFISLFYFHLLNHSFLSFIIYLYFLLLVKLYSCVVVVFVFFFSTVLAAYVMKFVVALSLENESKR